VSRRAEVKPNAEIGESSVTATRVSRGFFTECVTNRTPYAVDVTGGDRRSAAARLLKLIGQALLAQHRARDPAALRSRRS
jgi:hypothetical protein